MQKKASITVEAALLCPFLCLILCGMLVVTLQMYQKVDCYTTELIGRNQQEISSAELVRLEAVTEDMFRRQTCR